MMHPTVDFKEYLRPGVRVHLSGIGGVSMCPLAEVLLGMGLRVQGSDMSESDTVRHLRSLGIPVAVGHSADNLQNAQLVIRTAAIHDDNPEISGAVSRHGAGSAAVGDDRQAPTLRFELRRQGLGGIEELPHVLDADDAGAAYGGVEDAVGACVQARMRADRRRPRSVATGLEEQDRFDPRSGAQGAHEAA